jgi:hypothetical protein
MDPEQHENANERTDDRMKDVSYQASTPSEDVPQDGASQQRRGNRHHMGRRKNRSRKAAAARAAANGNGTQRSGNTAQTRGAMASGRTPGIRASEEPAAAPLGTDDEAAGTPAPVEAAEHETARAKQGRGRLGLTAAEAMDGPPSHQKRDDAMRNSARHGKDEATDGRPGHPEESPRSFGKFVTIAAAIIIALIVLMLVL